MPIWSLGEIQRCRDHEYKHLSEAETKSLYDKWGGIPRFVLDYANDIPQQELLDDAIKGVKLDSLIEAVGNLEAWDDATDLLIHLHIAENFLTKNYQFASEYVADKVYMRLYERNRCELIEFLAVSHGVGDLGVLRGVLFERHAHTVICNGGTFKIRELFDGESVSQPIQPLQLPQFQQFVFDEDEQVKSNGNGFYYRPRSSIYVSVDSFVKPSLLLQMTGAKKHPCKQVGIHKVLNVLGSPEELVLYFVVPGDLFTDFKYQKYEDSQGKAMQSGPTYANVKRVKQFVLAIELTGTQ